MLRAIIIEDGKYYLDHDNTENCIRLCIFFSVVICMTLPSDCNVGVYIMIMLQMSNQFMLKKQIIRKKHSELKSKWTEQYRVFPVILYGVLSLFLAKINHDPTQTPNTFLMICVGCHQLYQAYQGFMRFMELSDQTNKS